MPSSDTVVFVLFGATGDLAKRMVLPAFYEMARHGLLPGRWRLVGNGRGDVSHEDFQQHVHGVLKEFGPELDDDEWDAFRANLRFAGGGFEKSDPGSLLEVIDEAHRDLGDDAQYVHYLAIPPSAFIDITEGLAAHGLVEGARVVYEKPFGTSPDNFRELDKAVHSVLDEQQVYRIDHFLGKEASQDLHALRFGNGMIDAVWNREHVRAVQIDIPETLDIEDRAAFYDATGALLDMIVTHLFQLAAEIAMESPLSMGADDLQDARESVIAAFRPLDPADVVLGQFEGYTAEEGIADDSTQNTFVAARLWVDTDRWRDVPFLLRTGKQLAASEQRVTLIFREPERGPVDDGTLRGRNYLTFDLAGDGKVDLQFLLRRPGADFALTPALTSIELERLAPDDALPPYVKLIHDVIVGDRSLFTRPDGLEHAWDVITPILEHPTTLQPYARGSWGPQAAEELAGPDGWIAQRQPRGAGNPDA